MKDPTMDTFAVVAPVALETEAADDTVATATVATGSLTQADELEHTIQAFLAGVGSGTVSVSRVVNPLLQLWSVARDVDAVVAVPVEHLLTVLVGRALTTSVELGETMAEVRAVLAETAQLATV